MSVTSIKEAATRYATILSEVITVHAEMDSSFHQTIIRVMTLTNALPTTRVAAMAVKICREGISAHAPKDLNWMEQTRTARTPMNAVWPMVAVRRTATTRTEVITAHAQLGLSYTTNCSVET